ncbi:MAG: TonB-dependent receptor [Desulfobacterales bacterium]|nr:TonB-dependent receptor [Desulfobacterales bacterium]
MNGRWNLILLIFVWQCFSMNAWGQDADKVENTELESMTIIGAPAAPEAVEVSSRFYLPESVEAVQTLTREDIEAIQPRDVTDLIEYSLGMNMWKQGARIHTFSFSRGDEVSVILDGVYLTSNEARRMISDIPVEMIDSIKFVRDASVITIGPLMSFGSASAGSPNQGFIIIETRKKGPDTQYGTQLRASYASHDTFKASGVTGQSWQDDKFTFSAGYQRTQSQGRDGWNNGYTGDTLLLNGGFNSDALLAGVSLYYNTAEREIQRHESIYTGELNENAWEYDPIDTLLISINLTRPWNEHHATSLTYGWNRTECTRYMYKTTIDNNTVTGEDAEDSSREWNLIHSIATDRNTFKIGAQMVRWYYLLEGYTSAREEEIYGAYVTDAYKLKAWWSMDAALRVDKKKIIQGGDTYLSNGTQVKLSDGEWTDEAFVASLGNAWQINPKWKLTARYSFNLTPTPDVLTTVDDSELPDEQRHRWEVGVAADFNKAVRVSATPFYYNIKNAKVSAGKISTDANGAPILDPVTGDPTDVTVYDSQNRELYGFELSIKGRFYKEILGYELGWTHFVDTEEDGINGTENPENKFSGRLNWRYGGWRSDLTVLHVGPYSSYGYTVGDFTTVNLSVSRTMFNDVKVTLFGKNITDDEYATNNKGFPTFAQWGCLRDVGAAYGVEVSYSF